MKFYRYVIVLCLLLSTTLAGIAQEFVINRVELVGQLAYIGNDYNVYTIDLIDGNISQLTTDGTRDAGYEFPMWAKDGQLAYFCCSVRGAEPPRLSVHISSDGIATGEVFSESFGERHVYAYWSPVQCNETDCVDLAVLVQNFTESLLRVDLYNSQNNIATGQRDLGLGAPFYFSWSPSGEAMVIHRNNQNLQYYSVVSNDTVNAVDESLGSFLSPGWSPTDDRIIFASASDNQQSEIMILEDNVERALSNEIDGILSFSWSPNGEYVAYRYITQDAVSPVYVLDVLSGELMSQSNVSGVFSFFWSPDSKKIAYVTLDNPPGTFDIHRDTGGNTAYLMQTSDGLAWNILSIEDNSNILLNSFIPTTEMQYLLTNFDQFAQSHSIWSPDSQYIVYSEMTDIDEFQPHITLINTDEPNLESIQVAEGMFAIWSFE